MGSTNETASPKASILQRLVRDLVRDAREQKRRVRERLHALKGDEIRTPSRGPIQRNGMRCIRWHYWRAATAKHREITTRITAVKSRIPNGFPLAPGGDGRSEA